MIVYTVSLLLIIAFMRLAHASNIHVPYECVGFGATPGVFLSVASVAVPANLPMSKFGKTVVSFDTDKVQA